MHDHPWILTPEEIRFLSDLFNLLGPLKRQLNEPEFDAFFQKLVKEASRY